MDRSKRLDTILTWSIVGLVAAVIGLGAYFGYTVYRDRQAAEEATPALRVIKAIKTEIRKTPNDAILRVRLGEALSAAGKTQEAIEQFNAALKIDPKHTGALLDLGQIAMMNKQYNEARAYFQKVLKLSEGAEFEGVSARRETALFQLGMLELEARDYEAAVGNFKAALRIRKDASDTYYFLARALDRSGDPGAAIEQLQIALAFDPNFAQARYFLGDLYKGEDDTVSAVYEYSRAVMADAEAVEPRKALKSYGTSTSWVAKAKAALESGDQPAALDAVIIALSIDPNNQTAVELQAQVENVNKKAAKAYYKALALRDPANKDAKAAAARLAAKSDKKSSEKP
jgi:tetratricopeptide (TPR) repeat protein